MQRNGPHVPDRLGSIARAPLHRIPIEIFNEYVSRSLQINDTGGLFLRARDALSLG